MFPQAILLSIVAAAKRVPESEDTYAADPAVQRYEAGCEKYVRRAIDETFIEDVSRRYRAEDGLRVLDVGSGTGAIAMALAKNRQAWNLWGIDISGPMVERARYRIAQEKLSIDVSRASAVEMPFETEYFDLVYSHHALHEFKYPDRVLHEMIRVTKRGGSIVIYDLRRPKLPGWQTAAKLFCKLYYRGDVEMYCQAVASLKAAYSVSELKELLAAVGLKFEILADWVAGTPISKVYAVRQ